MDSAHTITGDCAEHDNVVLVIRTLPSHNKVQLTPLYPKLLGVAPRWLDAEFQYRGENSHLYLSLSSSVIHTTLTDSMMHNMIMIRERVLIKDRIGVNV